jgi:hypothetical protein
MPALRELARGLTAARRGRLDHELQGAQDAAEQREHQQQRPGTGTARGSGVEPNASTQRA